MVGNCDRFYFVKADDTCQQIARSHGISQAQLNIWNPSIGTGNSCVGLWANVYVCVRTIGFVPPTYLTCYDTTKTWGDNRPAALTSAGLWCDGNSNTDATGNFGIGQRKSGCYNAPFGENLFLFDMYNQWGTDKTLSVAKCNELLRIPINGCDRGGIGQLEGWQIR